MATFPKEIDPTVVEGARTLLAKRLGKTTDKYTLRAAIQLLEWGLGRNHFRRMPEAGTFATTVLEVLGETIAKLKGSAPRRTLTRHDELNDFIAEMKKEKVAAA
jgi:hypothetical protein